MFPILPIRSALLQAGLVFGVATGAMAQDPAIPESGYRVANRFANASAGVTPELTVPVVASSPTLESPVMPTVVVNPNHDEATHLKNCQLDVVPMEDNSGLRVRLNLPESVRLVELVPESTAESDPLIRISIDRPRSSESEHLITESRNRGTVASESVGGPSLSEGPSLSDNATAVPTFRTNPFFLQPVPTPAQDTRSRLAASLPTAARTISADPVSLESQAPVHGVLIETKVLGPRSLMLDDVVEFQIELKNTLDQNLEHLIVQLHLPTGFEPALFDRTVWVDSDSRKISWRIPVLKRNQTETIRYAVKSLAVGVQRQLVAVGSVGQSCGSSEIETLVTPSFDSDNDFHSPQPQLSPGIAAADRVPDPSQFQPIDLSRSSNFRPATPPSGEAGFRTSDRQPAARR